MSSEQMNPSVSRNHCAVSLTFGVPSTPWPIRLIGEGEPRSRISVPARRSGSAPEFMCWLATGIAGSASMPYTTAAAGLVDRLHRRGAGRLRHALKIVLAGRVVRQADEFGITLLGDMQ